MSVLSDWTSCLTPALTRSSRPTRFPFFPFPFSSAIAILFSAHVAAGVLPPPVARSPAGPLSPQKSAGLLKIGPAPPPPPVHPWEIQPGTARRGLFPTGRV